MAQFKLIFEGVPYPLTLAFSAMKLTRKTGLSLCVEKWGGYAG